MNSLLIGGTELIIIVILFILVFFVLSFYLGFHFGKKTGYLKRIKETKNKELS